MSPKANFAPAKIPDFLDGSVEASTIGVPFSISCDETTSTFMSYSEGTTWSEEIRRARMDEKSKVRVLVAPWRASNPSAVVVVG